MPICIEKILDPCARDRLDLSKIYEEAPAWLQGEASRAFAAQQRAAPGEQLYAARFNGRLLAAALLRDDGSRWTLFWLHVRPFTRARGLGYALVQALRARAAEQQVGLVVASPQDLAGLPAYLRR